MTVLSERRGPSRLEKMDRFVQWIVAGLVSWLCLSTMTLREQMSASLERDQNRQEHQILVDREIEHLMATDQCLAEMTKNLQIQAAAHGWK